MLLISRAQRHRHFITSLDARRRGAPMHERMLFRVCPNVFMTFRYFLARPDDMLAASHALQAWPRLAEARFRRSFAAAYYAPSFAALLMPF